MRGWHAAASGLVAALLAIAGSADAASIVSGAIRSDTTWRAQDGPFDVVADVTVAGGATLTIEAGATLHMRAGVNLSVEQGALRALGTAAQPVVITSVRDQAGDTPAPGDWGALRFLAGTNAAATLLERVEIRYGSGLRLEQASATLNDVTVAGHAGPAITIDLQSSLFGAGNRAIGNTVNAVVVPAGDILGDVKWDLRGIPFVIPAGTVGIGAPPIITAIEPARIEQGETLDAVVRGSRLGGAESLTLGSPGVSAVVRDGGSDTQVPVTLSAGPAAEVGVIAAEAQVAAGRARLDDALTVIPPLPPIAVTGVTPGSIRRGETRSFAVSGAWLLGATAVVTNHPGVQLTGLQTTDTQATFSLTAAADAALNTASIELQNPAVAKGIGTAQVTVRKALPQIVVTPSLLGVPPDNATRQFRIGLNDSDDEDHAFSVAVGDATVVNVTPLAFTVAAGQTQQVVSIRGLKTGATSLTITSPGLTTTTAQVLVTPEYDRINASQSALVGVELAASATPGTRTAQPLVSPALGVSHGRYIEAIAPASLQVGSGPTTLVIRGAGLESVTGVAILPPTGITLGSISVNGDGTAVSVPVTVAVDAAPTLRQVSLAGAHQPYAASRTDSNRLRIVLPPPEIESIEPLFVAPGTVATLVVRGRNLQGATLVSAAPGSGLSLGAWPQVSGDGTVLTTALGVAGNAAPGLHAISVATAGGVSPAAATSANTLRVVSTVQSVLSPIAAAGVGVEKASTATPAALGSFANSTPLGISVGSVVVERTPAVGTIGETLTLELRGAGLQGVDAVSLLPATGVTAGAPAVNAEGTALTVSLVIAPDAPQTLRAIQVRAGAASIPFAAGATALFRITPPQPRIESIEPVVLRIGGPTAMLTVRGANFQNASAVRILPADGITVSTPPSVASSASLSINVTVAAGAAPGPRTVVVVTPAGETDGAPAANNTVRLANTLSPVWTPLVSPHVGVSKDSAPVPASRTVEPVVGPALGAAVGPVVVSVESPTLRPYTVGEVILRGYGLDQVTAVSLSPAGEVTLGSTFQVNAEGTELRIAISVGGNPFGGAREIVLQTAAGRVPFAYASAAALIVVPGTQYFLLGPNVGVELAAQAPSSTTAATLSSGGMGVAVGPIVTGVQAPSLYPGANGVLTILGQELQQVTGVIFRGAAGLTAAAPAANAEGTQLSVSITAAADAARGVRELVLSTAAGPAPFADADTARVAVASGVPTIDSIEPIVWRQGETFTLTVRGSHLGLARAVVPSPAQGVAVDASISVSADGTLLTARIGVAVDAAPTEEGFVTLTTPGGSTPAVRSPANGFRIVH